MDCCWDCFGGRSSHPTTTDGEPDPNCDENCPVPDEEKA
jgi:hypothetical protein